ncbi:DUF4097 family beta strand repeat-containing protein [Wukongibacter sp. M2B1]|uniref:DUF4097 family beta strand repeat-containing protein n=1 Tax=Wukongibacter sp. M2B1 TaxID=3088895 RepID=UPI003D7AAB43
MKERKMGIFTLAITLILLGGLFLLNNFTQINIYYILSIFWPSVIIILGLEIVFSKFIFEKSEAKTKLSISGKSIFFILLIVFMSFTLSWIHKIPLDIDIDGDFIPLSYKKETVSSKDITIDVNDKNKLKVINSFGYVNVKKGEDKDIKVSMSTTIRHNSDNEEAKKIADKIIEIIDDTGDSIKLINQREKYTINNEIGDIEVNLDIMIPDGIEVDITNKHGYTSLINCKGTSTIYSEHGNIFVENLIGDLNIKDAHSDVEVIDIDGKAIVKNKHGKVFAKNIGKDLNIVNEHGDVSVNSVGGNVDIDNSHQSIEVEKIGGNLIIESEFCKIDINEIDGDIKVNGKHGNIGARDIDGNVRISNEHGRIKLSSANKIIELQNKNDEIVFESNKVISGRLKVENEHGGIDIKLPKNQEGRFYVYTNYGKISNNFDLKINTNNSEESINEIIGEKNTEVNIKAQYGDIRIEN